MAFINNEGVTPETTDDTVDTDEKTTLSGETFDKVVDMVWSYIGSDSFFNNFDKDITHLTLYKPKNFDDLEILEAKVKELGLQFHHNPEPYDYEVESKTHFDSSGEPLKTQKRGLTRIKISIPTLATKASVKAKLAKLRQQANVGQ